MQHRRAFLLALITCAAPGAPAIAQEPDPVILRPAAVHPEPISRVRGMRELADGRVLIADQLENAVYMTDFAAGTRIHIGRNGPGPEEYNEPTGLYVAHADSSYLVDISNGRVSVLSPGGRVVRSEPLFGENRSIPAAADTFGNLYWDNVVGVRMAKRQNPDADQANVIRLSQGGAVDTLGYLMIPGGPRLSPFPSWDAWAVGRDGRIVVIRNRKPYRVEIYAPDGSHRTGPEIPFDEVHVSGADRAAYAAGNRKGGSIASVSAAGSGSGRRPESDFPDRFPPVREGRMWVADDGRAWVQRHQHLNADGLVYDVFDRDGNRVARYRLPPDTEVIGFGRRGMYAVRVDSVGLQWLERFDVGVTR